MFRIGCHLSASGGYARMARDAQHLGAHTFQFFTRNPRGGRAKDLDPEDLLLFETLAREAEIPVILAHAPYTMNLCSADAGIRRFARETLADDLRRMEFTPYNLYNLHPGSHVGQGTENGIAQIAEGMKDAKNKPVVIENRVEAIGWALDHARENDIILLCGKGHETYQEVGHEKRHMDEREIVAEHLEREK